MSFFSQKAPGAYKKLVGCHYLKNVNEITCIITGLSGSHWSWAKYENSGIGHNKELTKVEIINANDKFYENRCDTLLWYYEFH